MIVVDEHILKLNISMHDVPIMDVDQCLDQLRRDVPNLLRRQRIVVLHILQQRLIPCKFHNKADLSQRLCALDHLKNCIMMQILHDVDLLPNIFEFMRIFVHLELLIHLYRHQLLNYL